MTRGELLKKLRIDNGYTQKEVAERIGVHPATVMKYETRLKITEVEQDGTEWKM